jgi:hypothetical protein
MLVYGWETGEESDTKNHKDHLSQDLAFARIFHPLITATLFCPLQQAAFRESGIKCCLLLGYVCGKVKALLHVHHLSRLVPGNNLL